MAFEEKTISSQKIFSGKVVDLRTETVMLPDGKTGYRELVNHPGGVGVLAITDKNRILLVRQYRKAIEKEIFEIPAGKLEKGEDPLKCGMRELEEETGYKSKNFTYLGYLYPSPGFVNEVTHLYLAENLEKGIMNPDDDEYLDIKEIDPDELYNLIINNEICDAKTVIAYFKAMEYIKNR